MFSRPAPPCPPRPAPTCPPTAPISHPTHPPSAGYPAAWFCLAWLSISRGAISRSITCALTGLSKLQLLSHYYAADACQGWQVGRNARGAEVCETVGVEVSKALSGAHCGGSGGEKGSGDTDDGRTGKGGAGKGGGGVAPLLRLQQRLEALLSLAYSRNRKHRSLSWSLS